MGCIGMGKGRSPWGSVRASNFFVLLTTSKLWQDFVYHDSSPRFCLSCSHLLNLLGWQSQRDATDRTIRPGQARPGQAGSTDRLTDRLAHSYALSSDALRLSFEFNRIYKFYLCDMGAFCFVPPSVYRGMKVPVPREREDHKWSVSAICNAFSRFSIGNVWISDAISGKGKSRK